MAMIVRASGAGAGSSTVGRPGGMIVLTDAPYNADPTGTVAFDDAVDAAIADLSAEGAANPSGSAARNGGIIYLPPGYYKQTRAHTIAKHNVVIRGAGRQTSQILLDPATFPTSTSAWNITAPGDSGTVFASRLEDLTLNCRNIAGSIGVQTLNGQEGSGLRGVRVREFKDIGFYAHASSPTSAAKPAEMVIEDCEFWGSSTDVNYGVRLDDCASTMYLRDTTLLTLGAVGGATWLAAVYVTTASLHAENLHIEKFADGIRIGTDAVVAATSIQGGNGPGATASTGMVHILGSVPSRAMLTHIANGNGNVVYDEPGNQTIPQGVQGSYMANHTSSGNEPWKFIRTVAVRKLQSSEPALMLKDNTSTASTATLQQWKDAGSNNKAEMMANGLLRLGLAANTTTNWSDGHLQLGPYHLWVDDTGRLRVKNGAPTSATDGTVVGAQT